MEFKKLKCIKRNINKIKNNKVKFSLNGKRDYTMVVKDVTIEEDKMIFHLPDGTNEYKPLNSEIEIVT